MGRKKWVGWVKNLDEQGVGGQENVGVGADLQLSCRTGEAVTAVVCGNTGDW